MCLDGSLKERVLKWLFDKDYMCVVGVVVVVEVGSNKDDISFSIRIFWF